MRNTSQLSTQSQTALGNWLNTFDWTHWATLTTKYQLTLKSGRRIATGFHRELSRAGDTKIFWAAEPFDLKEGYHLHALIKIPNILNFNNIIQTYQHVSGNKNLEKGDKWNRIQLENYNPKLGASHYISKYITKKLCDYDVLFSSNTIKY